MNRKRVVVTGMGTLAPNGNSVKEYWTALINGKSGIRSISSFDTTDFSTTFAGQLEGFDPTTILEPKEVRKMDPFSIFAICASHEAFEQANFDWDKTDNTKFGVFLGTGVGGIQTLEEQHTKIMDRGPRRVSPQFVPKMIANIAAGQVSIRWGLKGPSQTVTSACASATDAIGIAMRLIQSGTVDMMITGGTEASVTPLTIAGFGNMKALSTRNDAPSEASRPFEKNRDGFVLSEGAGILILESAEHAQKRGAIILAELAGYGSTDDAFHVTQPVPGGSGATSAMNKAIEDAQLKIEDIHYINAHGTSTYFNDKTETAAIKNALGKHAYQVKISSTKSMTGHLLGASGAIEAVASIKAILENKVPPTINHESPDPECDLDYVPNIAVETQVDTVLSNSFGFGGHNAVLLLRRWKE